MTKAAPDGGRDLVSVIVPAYNAALTIQETIASAQAQTWRDLEIVVVDDGSTDDTAAIAERMAADDPRIRVLRKSNGGVSSARNAGAAACRGAFVTPVDADDVLHPTRIARQMARMAELGPRCGVVYTLAATIDMAGRITGTKGFPGFEGAVYLRGLAVNFVGNGSALLIRREALLDVGGYDEAQRNCDDWLLQSLIARRWRWGAVNEALTGYRSVPGSKKSNHLKMRLAQLQAVRRLAERYPETPADVIAAAEAMGRGQLCVLRLRLIEPLAAIAEFARAVALSPRVALETVFVVEFGRLGATALDRGLRALRLRREPEPGPPFLAADPRAALATWPRPPFARLLRRFEAREEAVFLTPSRAAGVEDVRLDSLA
ncbi:glycosyltransferase family 2 protein [Rubrimonas sp.]|uniref:glycosyltransferase family 2 protein n=1 Tax=Rubrimonas sp. TaxID=2036015 RepID=UPI002FDEB90B